MSQTQPVEGLAEGKEPYVLKVTIKVIAFDWTVDGNITFTAGGENLYDMLLIPLYELLGITNYAAPSEIAAAGSVNGGGKRGDVKCLPGYGYDLWSKLLDPLFTWLEGTMFANPVGTN